MFIVRRKGDRVPICVVAPLPTLAVRVEDAIRAQGPRPVAAQMGLGELAVFRIAFGLPITRRSMRLALKWEARRQR